MSKKIIIVAAAGLVSFAGAFTFAWLTKSTPASTEAGEAALRSQESQQKPPELQIPGIGQPVDSQMKRAMTEKQLKTLVYEIRDKIQEYDNKLQGLKVHEQRLQMAHNELKKDIDGLNNLRTELASTIATLKEEQDKLDKSKVEIAKVERDNLMSIAAAYDKMDPASAGKILVNISKTQNTSSSDAVKILYYMTDRTKANLLAEIAASEPALASYFCQKLKQMIEKK